MDKSNSPIGIFDSGFGGLTIARAVSRYLPHESFVYIGDTGRCPYGSRDPNEVRLFARQIGRWLERYGVKLIVIACNTATVAGLHTLQNSLSVPVIGVIESGAQAAVEVTRLRHVGILATRGTVRSGAYVRAIRTIDAGIYVMQCSAQPLVDIVEQKVMSQVPPGLRTKYGRKLFDTFEVRLAVQKTVAPFVSAGVDTVILGCTHFPLLFSQIHEALGKDVRIVSPTEKVCQKIATLLEQNGSLAPPDRKPTYQFATTSHNCVGFAAGARFVFGNLPGLVTHLDLVALEALGE